MEVVKIEFTILLLHNSVHVMQQVWAGLVSSAWAAIVLKILIF